MLNFLGRRNSDQYTLALADAKLSALTLLADKTNLFGTCNNPAGPAGAWHANSHFSRRLPSPVTSWPRTSAWVVWNCSKTT